MNQLLIILLDCPKRRYNKRNYFCYTYLLSLFVNNNNNNNNNNNIMVQVECKYAEVDHTRGAKPRNIPNDNYGDGKYDEVNCKKPPKEETTSEVGDGGKDTHEVCVVNWHITFLIYCYYCT